MALNNKKKKKMNIDFAPWRVPKADKPRTTGTYDFIINFLATSKPIPEAKPC